MKKTILSGVLAVICIITCIYSFSIYNNIDKEPPQISFNNSALTYNQGDDQRILLSDVTAFDDVDGNISENVIIVRVSIEKNVATVIYAVQDSSHNVTEKARKLTYIPKKTTTTKTTTKK